MIFQDERLSYAELKRPGEPAGEVLVSRGCGPGGSGRAAALPSAVEVVLSLCILDGLPEMLKRTINGALGKDDAELPMNRSETLDILSWE